MSKFWLPDSKHGSYFSCGIMVNVALKYHSKNNESLPYLSIDMAYTSTKCVTNTNCELNKPHLLPILLHGNYF